MTAVIDLAPEHVENWPDVWTMERLRFQRWRIAQLLGDADLIGSEGAVAIPTDAPFPGVVPAPAPEIDWASADGLG